MKIKCTGCGYEFESEENKRCPRCGKFIRQDKGCENCKGCSLFGTCSPKQ